MSKIWCVVKVSKMDLVRARYHYGGMLVLREMGAPIKGEIDLCFDDNYDYVKELDPETLWWTIRYAPKESL